MENQGRTAHASLCASRSRQALKPAQPQRASALRHSCGIPPATPQRARCRREDTQEPLRVCIYLRYLSCYDIEMHVWLCEMHVWLCQPNSHLNTSPQTWANCRVTYAARGREHSEGSLGTAAPQPWWAPQRYHHVPSAVNAPRRTSFTPSPRCSLFC